MSQRSPQALFSDYVFPGTVRKEITNKTRPPEHGTELRKTRRLSSVEEPTELDSGYPSSAYCAPTRDSRRRTERDVPAPVDFGGAT